MTSAGVIAASEVRGATDQLVMLAFIQAVLAGVVLAGEDIR